MKPQPPKERSMGAKGQTSLDFLMTYGWAVLLVVVVVASLFALGVFNAGSFLGPRATGFSQLGVIAWNINAAGILSLKLQNFAGMDINVINIEATYGTSHYSYDITNVSIPNSKISDTFTVGAIGGLAPGQYYTLPLRITYIDLNGFNYTETGTISGTVGAGAVPPSLRINSPSSNSLLNNRTINISVSVWGANLSHTDIMIIDETGTPVNVTTSSQLGTYSVLLSVDADGVYNITALANYTDGGSASATASNITVNIIPCVPENIARTHGNVTDWSSQYPAEPYYAYHVIDGLYDGEGEWATASQPTGWVRIDFDDLYTIDEIHLYDRAAPETVTSGHVEFSDGSLVLFGSLGAYEQTPLILTFSPRNVTWVKVFIDSSSGGNNPGIAEIEVYSSCGNITQPICGNGVVEGTEQCDDGNTISGDGCNSTCQFEPPPCASPENVALTHGDVTDWSSQYPAEQHYAYHVIDGAYGDCGASWATNSEPTGWVRIDFDNSYIIDKINLYDRACSETVTSGHVEFSDGSLVLFGSLGAYEQTPLILTFSPRNVTWIKVFIDSSSGGSNPGIAEIEALSYCSIQCIQPPSGLVAWWPGDGNATDIIGGNGGVWNGTENYTSGMVNQSFSFDGMSLFSIPASPNLDVGTGSGFTIDAWVSPNDFTLSPIFEWYDIDDGWGVHVWISQFSPGDIYANIVDNTRPYYPTGGGIDHMVSSPSVLSLNAFSHIALTYDKSSGVARIYANGSVVADQNIGTFTPQTSYDVYIGSSPTSLYFGPAYYSGLVDEVQVYGRALNASEIQAIYDAGNAGVCRPQPYLLVNITAPLNDSVLDSSTVEVNFTVSGTGLNHTNVSILRSAVDDYVWVPNYSDGTVSKIDKATNVVAANITVSSDLAAVAMDDNYVWVANAAGNTVSKIDKATNTVIGSPIAVGTDPMGIAVDDRDVWVANMVSQSITQIDKQTDAVVHTIDLSVRPFAIAVDRDYVWFVSPDSGAYKINKTDYAVEFLSSSPASTGIAIDENYIWIDHWDGTTITKISKESGSIAGTMDFGVRPRDIMIDEDYAWIDGWVSNSILQANKTSGALVDTIGVGSIPDGIYGISIDNDYVWVPDRNANTVLRINKATRAIDPTAVGSVPVMVGDCTGYQYDRFFSMINSTTVSTASPGDYSAALDVPSDGAYDITATVYDTLGNSNSSEASNITVNTPAQPEQAIELSGCSNISYSGGYVLSGGQYGYGYGGLYGDDCFDIQAGDVTLDCNGSTLTGLNNGSGYGVYGSGQNNVTLENCNITRFNYGIYLSGDSNTVSGVTAEYNNGVNINGVSASSGYGIYLSGGSNIISGVTVKNNYGGNGCGNSCHGGNGYGIYLSGGSNTISGVTVGYNGGGGNSGANSISGNSYGIYLSGDSNTISDATVERNTGGPSWSSAGSGGYAGYGYGIFLNSSGSNTISDVTVTYNNGGPGYGSGCHGGNSYGIFLNSSGSNMISGSVVENNIGGTNSGGTSGHGFGVYLVSSSDNLIYNVLLDDETPAYSNTGGNDWNTTLSCSGSQNIIDGPCIGGNFYSGFSYNASSSCNPSPTYHNSTLCQGAYTIPGGSGDTDPYTLAKVDCGSLGPFNAPDTVYTLSFGMASRGTCFTIGADNITIDCNGYSITGDGSGYGVNNSAGYDRVTVRNCVITRFSNGIDFENSANYGTIENDTIYSNGNYGVYLGSSSNTNTIANDNISSNGNYGIYFSSSSGNIIANGTIKSNGNYGIRLDSSSGNLLYNNFLNNSNNIQTDGSPNLWNTTLSCDTTNIIGGPCIGGNFWANLSGNGWSQVQLTCDANSSGICAVPYAIPSSSDVDYLPITDLPPAPLSVNITVPLSNTLVTTPIAVNFTAMGGYLQYTNISIYNSTGDLVNSTSNYSGGPIGVQLGVPEGDGYNITATAYDTLGHNVSSMVSGINATVCTPSGIVIQRIQQFWRAPTGCTDLNQHGFFSPNSYVCYYSDGCWDGMWGSNGGDCWFGFGGNAIAFTYNTPCSQAQPGDFNDQQGGCGPGSQTWGGCVGPAPTHTCIKDIGTNAMQDFDVTADDTLTLTSSCP